MSINTFITLQGVKFYAYHGVFPAEKKVGNHYEITLTVGYDFTAAFSCDELSNTLDYGAIYEVVKKQMQQPAQLIEHVAGGIVTALQQQFEGITSIHLTLAKLSPPIVGDIERAVVTVNWTK